MRDEDLPRFLVEWDNLLLDLHEPPPTKILESLFRQQVHKHQWMKLAMAEYNRFKPSHPNKTYEWLRGRVKEEPEPTP